MLLDIRSHDEYCQGHICGAINVNTPIPPLSRTDHTNLAQQLVRVSRGLPKHTKITLYCKKGIRAGIAEQILHQLGFYNALSIGGVHKAARPLYIDLKQFRTCMC